jgi:hypothetical protein
MVAGTRPRSGLLHCAGAAGVVLERSVSVSADNVLAMTILSAGQRASRRLRSSPPCVEENVEGRGGTRSAAMDHDRPVNEFLVSYLDAIEKRLLEYFEQDDRCTAPWLPSQGDRGSCTT